MGFYGPLKTAYSQACDDFLVFNPGACITITHVPKIFYNAYLKVTTLQTAVNAFRATEIEPFDSNIFRDEDFQPSLTTNIQTVECSTNFERHPEPSPDNVIAAIASNSNKSFAIQNSQIQPIVSESMD